MEQVAADYEQEFGIRVEVNYGGSGSLLNQLQTNHFGTSDLYLAADDDYTNKAVAAGLAEETLPIAYQSMVIAVAKGNPKKIRSFDDLLRDDVRVAIADPAQAAVGKAAKRRLEPLTVGDTNKWELLFTQIQQNGVVKSTVNEVATDVQIGTVIDAAIVWDSTVQMRDFRDHIEGVSMSELKADPDLVSIALLNSSRHPTAALRFARYLASRDKGLEAFSALGMQTVIGDVWAEQPEITFFCGAVNRKAIEATVKAFEEREGCIVHTKFNGCGSLTGEMQTFDQQKTEQGFPDVYMACDRYYLDNVADWFEDVADVSEADLVIVVPKESNKVKTLADFVKPEVSVAVGEPDSCTIGALTRRLLVAEGLYDDLIAKRDADAGVVVESTSSALLVPQIVGGQIDATVAYITDTLPHRDQLDIIPIDAPGSVAVQPFGVSRTSHHKYLVRRLFQKIRNSRRSVRIGRFPFSSRTRNLHRPYAHYHRNLSIGRRCDPTMSDSPSPSDRFGPLLPIAQRRLTLTNLSFQTLLTGIGGAYVLFVLCLMIADVVYVIDSPARATGSKPSGQLSATSNPIVTALKDPNIQSSIRLSLLSCSLSAILSVIVAVPLGFQLSRHKFWGRGLVEAIIDIPIVLPPLVIGLSLLILFQFRPFAWIASDVVYRVPAVVLAQFSVACAFAIRTMRGTFDQIDPRPEQVALTLGCNRIEAFGWVTLPQAWRGLLSALTLAWARSLGEFGPLLIFAGTTRMRTEVLSTSVFLEMNVGNVAGAVAVSLIMIALAIIVLLLTRIFGLRILNQ